MINLKHIWILLILLSSYSYTCSGYATLNDVQNVFESYILPNDHRYRPVLDQSQPIVVRIGLELMSLVDVDEVHQTLSTNVLLTLSWQDEFRTWIPSNYGGLTSVSPDPLDVWRPRLFVSNTVADRDMFKDDYAPLTLFYNGTTIWQPGGILHTSCPMKLARYPFDRHSCKLAFTSGESSEEIQFKTIHSNISLDFYETNGEWDLSTSSIDIDVATQSQENIPHLSFNFLIRRKVSFAILCILMPVIVISSLPALVFITPVDSGERVTFSITVFLSLTFSTEQMSGNFPKNSESLPLLVIYLACLLMHSSLAVCVNLFVLLKQSSNQNKVKQSTTPDESCYEFDRTTSFVSISDNYELDLMSTSHDILISYPERVPKLEPNKNKHMVTVQEKSSRYFSDRKFCRRIRYFFKKHNQDNSCTENVTNNGNLKKTSYFRLPTILKQMNRIDIILFIVFFCIWLLLAVVFIILQVGDYGQK